MASARADSADVRVDCPQLTGEQAAELEARAQATLLTSDVRAKAEIICNGDGAEIRVEASGEQVALQAHATPATLRDEVQRALDQALQELRARRAVAATDDATTTDDAIAPSVSAPEVPVDAAPAPAATPPAVARAPARPLEPPRKLPTPRVPEPQRVTTELSATLLGEMWSDRVALGGGLRGALAPRSGVEVGVRAGLLHPLGLTGFSANEVHVLVEGTVEPQFAQGLRLSLAVGASVLVVAPDPALSAPEGTTRAALRAEVQLGRAFRWGWFQFLPSVGLHLFSKERGVRIDSREQLRLTGVGPQLGLAFGYRD